MCKVVHMYNLKGLQMYCFCTLFSFNISPHASDISVVIQVLQSYLKYMYMVKYRTTVDFTLETGWDVKLGVVYMQLASL